MSVDTNSDVSFCLFGQWRSFLKTGLSGRVISSHVHTFLFGEHLWLLFRVSGQSPDFFSADTFSEISCRFEGLELSDTELSLLPSSIFVLEMDFSSLSDILTWVHFFFPPIPKVFSSSSLPYVHSDFLVRFRDTPSSSFCFLTDWCDGLSIGVSFTLCACVCFLSPPAVLRTPKRLLVDLPAILNLYFLWLNWTECVSNF